MNFKIFYDSDDISITLDKTSMYGEDSYLLFSLAHFIVLNANQDTIIETNLCKQRFITGEIDINKITFLGNKINDLSIL